MLLVLLLLLVFWRLSGQLLLVERVPASQHGYTTAWSSAQDRAEQACQVLWEGGEICGQ